MRVVDMAPSRKFDAAQYNEWKHNMQEVVQELLTVMTLDGMAARATPGSPCWHSTASRARLFLIPILERAFWASDLSLIHIWRCRRSTRVRHRSPLCPYT